MEKQLNSSGNIFQRFSSLQILQEIQKDWARKNNIQPEEFKDRIIFMSMFNDIDWSRRKNDENWILNAKKVKNYAMKFSQEHWTFLSTRSEEKWYRSSSYAQKGEWDSLARRVEIPYTSMEIQQTQNSGSRQFIL